MRTSVKLFASRCCVLFVLGSVVSCGPKQNSVGKPHTEVISEDAGVPDAAVAEPEPPKPPDNVFTRIGGKDGVKKIVDEFVDGLYADKKLVRVFGKLKKNAEKDGKFRELLAEHLCADLGGGCTYTGRDMRAAHKGLRLTQVDWNNFIEHFTQVLIAHKVNDNDQSEIFSLFGRLQKDVMQK